MRRFVSLLIQRATGLVKQGLPKAQLPSGPETWFGTLRNFISQNATRTFLTSLGFQHIAIIYFNQMSSNYWIIFETVDFVLKHQTQSVFILKILRSNISERNSHVMLGNFSIFAAQWHNGNDSPRSALPPRSWLLTFNFYRLPAAFLFPPPMAALGSSDGCMIMYWPLALPATLRLLLRD